MIFLKSWIWTGYFSNSTSSSITSGWFSPFIDLRWIDNKPKSGQVFMLDGIMDESVRGKFNIGNYYLG